MKYIEVIEFIIFISIVCIVSTVIYIMYEIITPSPMNECVSDDFSKLETSVVTIDPYPIPFVNINSELVDSNGYRYIIYGNPKYYKQYEGHNITFGYNCIGGRRVINGVYMDNDKTYNAYGEFNDTHYITCDYKIDLRWDVNKTCGHFEYGSCGGS